MGPILMSLIIDDKLKTKKHLKELEESESNDRHRRWFQTLGLINRERRPSWYRSIPPPPPITRRGPSHVELNRAERLRLDNERERVDKNGLNGFKFFQK
jgi:hypothetical protein